MWLKLTYSENERLFARETEDFERQQRQPEENLASGEQTFSRGGGGVGVILQNHPPQPGKACSQAYCEGSANPKFDPFLV